MQDSAQAQKVAGYASQTGSFLANKPTGDAAASMARGMAAGTAGNEVEQWLSRFGSARVKLDVDEHFSLKNSKLDMIVPLYDRDSDLIFTQGSLHRTDDRTQLNFGAGWRHFTNMQMTGANLFYDRDLSRNHARLGLGGEYWRDFLKLGANGYFRLSNWRDSHDVTDYEERPANGWDLRAQAWLPALPQLGVMLTFEQYYGKEVGLFGKDNRQHNPHALTAGVNYTPFPLLTLSADHRQGKHGQNDARLGVGLTWQPGVSWQQHVSPDAVVAMRSLVGNRYDMIERNNSIVLEYRKKEVIRLRTASLVTGYAGEQKSLGVSVNSKYGLARIDWDAEALTAAGGSIVGNSSDWAVILPAWQASEVNSYTVSGVAVDTKGNRSERTTTQVTVQTPTISAKNSSFIPAQSTLPANGKSSQVLTLILKDGRGSPVSVPADEVQFTTTELNGASISSPRLKEQGVYEVTVTAGIQTSTVHVTPQVAEVILSPALIIMEDTLPDAKLSGFTATPDNISADGIMVSTLSLKLKNAAGAPLTDQANHLSFLVVQDPATSRGLDGVTVGDISETKPGIYSASLTGTAEGRFRITPQYDGNVLGDLNVKVALTAATPDVSNLKLAGKLEAGQTLTATYAFAANGGNSTDKSTYAWGYEGTTGSAVTTGETVAASGQVPGRNLTTADVGKVMELSVQARNGTGTTGNTATVSTDSGGSGTEGGNGGGTVIDPAAAPDVSNLKLAGKLEAGQTLTATYAFAANGGNSTDKSTYAWGYEGTTGSAVTTGETVAASGQVPGRNLTTADVGKVMELSVQARNGTGTTGNTATVSTDSGGSGTEGGNGGGTVIDPAATPDVSNLKLAGKLEAGQTLTATYAFAANGGNSTDKSTYAWGYEGTTGSAVTTGETVAASGQVPGRNLTTADVGKVMELSVQARNGTGTTGNTQTVATSNEDPGTEGGNEGGTVIDPAAQPQVSDLKLAGKLEAGQTLTATYAFAANGGNSTDKSTYAWGYEGTTGSAVTTGETVAASGQVPGRNLTTADVGKVMELSVQARNGTGTTGNTATVSTDSGGSGTEGGNGGGTVIDPAATPDVSNLKLAGKLEAGQTLTATYAFAANGGNSTDKSTYAWGYEGTTGSAVTTGETVAASGQVPGRNLTTADVGKVMELSVQARNGTGTTGNTQTVATSNEDPGTEGGNEGGTVIDPAAQPQVSDLKLAGKLEAGQTLTATYAFAANGGNSTDKSTYAWGYEGTTGSAVTTGETVAASGQVPGRNLTTADVGKVMELSVQARNGTGTTGNTATVSTDSGGSGTEGGNGGGTVIDPAATPDVSNLKLAGKLEAGQTLTATYAFAANGGNSTDKSTYAWGYEGTTGSAVTTGETVAASGQVPGRNLTTADVGKVMELSVQARNGTGTTGNTATVSTDSGGSGTEGGNGGGTVIDPAATPDVSNLKLAGKLEAGQTLTATYAFAANGGNSTDKSTYAWGYEGTTGSAVTTGETVAASGQVPGRNLTTADVGKVMELSVQARNGTGTTGNTATVSTDSGGSGTEGGNGGGTVIDPAAAPDVSNLKLAGKLEAGQTLTATYAFAANGGNSTDKSTYAWGYEGTTGSAVTTGETVAASGQVPGRNLTTADVGKVMELSVQARNGTGTTGNTQTVATSNEDPGTEGGNEGGTVIDPAAQPQVSDLKLAGKLEAGQTLTATYAFAANGGNSTDKSTYAWGYEGTTGSAVTTGETVAASGQVPGRNLTTADVGKVMELSVQARNGTGTTGNTQTVATSNEDPGTEGGNEGGTVIDPAAQPQVSDLKLAGKLEAGQTLTATYAFAANGGNSTDKSTYAWGYEGTTGSAVTTGETVAASGQVPGRNLTTADVGKVMELSVQARNGTGTTGNTATVSTDSGGSGTEGGNGGGTVIDPAATPDVSNLKLAGKLEAGQTLTATYAFAANGGNSTDKSTYAWGYEGTTGSAVTTGETVAASGQVPGRNLTTADVGKVMELSVQARNGTGTTGNTQTVATSNEDPGTEGGNEGGTVIDPAAQPQVSDLKLAGKLEAGQTLTATYAFAANGGNSTDKSTYAWGYEGTTGSAVTTGETVAASGQVPGRNLTTADVGKVMELSVQARNGTGTTGNTQTVATSNEDPGTEGGNEGGTVIDPAAQPQVSDLKLAGKLEAGQTLTATYAFAANGGNSTDKSTYAWGYEGTTGSAVTTGETVAASGQVPGRNLTTADVGKVMELSVQARNGTGTTGNTATVSTDSGGSGTEGGNGGGTVIDPAATPDVSNLKLAGKLEAGQTLTATYAFAANGGNSTDKSTYAWGYEGTTGSAVTTGETVAASGQVPGRNLTTADVGKVMELSVQARNGTGTTGNTATVSTDSGGSGTEGGNGGGTVIDPVATPDVSNLKLAGKLEAGQTLTATYAFAANGGNSTDKSTYAWGYEGTTGSAVTTGETVAASGQVPGRNLTTADVGKVMELSVQARNGTGTTGNTATVSTDSGGSGTEGGNGGGTVIDPAAAPDVSNLKLAGKLEAGQTLTATYAFAANGGNSTDKSTYAWGYEGTTGSAVTTGETVAASGQVPGRNLTTADVGKVMELSVQARNGTGTTGNTATVSTDSGGSGTEGGNGGGTVIDPAATPDVSNLKLAGKLEAGQTLTATYAFAANGGNSTDKSTYAWGYEGTTGSAVTTGETVAASGQVPGRNLTTADVGKVMELSVQARNGTGTTGNTQTVATSNEDPGTEGGNEGGTVIDPAAQPQVSDLKLAGKLEAGQTLTATYAFAANGGNSTDKSTYAWGYEGTTGSAVTTGETVAASGQVPGRDLTTADVGKVMELSVLAKNGADATGNTFTVNSSDAITAGNPVQINSGIKTDATSYVSGSDMAVTVTLKDASNNAVTGKEAALTVTSVTVPNATLKSSGWTDNGDGRYTAVYTATTASTKNQATLQLEGWSTASQSVSYSIKLESPLYLYVNGYQWNYNFTNFPKTGFIGATFTIALRNGKKASDYDWVSDASWVSVTEGVVKFISQGTDSKVTIKGTPKSGQGNMIGHSFTLDKWFITNGTTLMNWSGAKEYCISHSGFRQPGTSDITNNDGRRAVGKLWSEWGSLENYTGFSRNNIWTRDEVAGGSHFSVNPNGGTVYSYETDSNNLSVACVQDL